MRHATELYRHYDADGALLYVGVSLSSLTRMIEHRRLSDWFPRVAKVEIESFPSRKEALEAEQKAINNEHPLYNKTCGAGVGCRSDATEDMGEIALRLRSSGKSLQEIADAINVSPATVSRWRKGEIAPRIENVRALAVVLGCDLDDILPGKDGGRVAERLRNSDKSLREIAEAVGVSQATVSRWRRGEMEPRIDSLSALANVLGCKVDDIVPEVESAA